MAVNLNGVDLSGTAVGTARKVSAPPGSAASPENAAPRETGEVSITSTAALLAHLQQTLSAQPAIDSSRVEALSRSISGGTYSIQPDKVASGLIQSERALSQLPLKEI